MSTIEESLVDRLADTGAVTTLVGSRIYPNMIPQDAALPALAYQKISGVRNKFHDGPGYARSRVQMTARAATYASAKTVINAVRVALEGFRGLLGGSTGANVYEISIDGEVDGFDQAAGHSTVRMDLIILHEE